MRSLLRPLSSHLLASYSPLALAADATSVRPNAEVVARKWVAALTVRLAGVCRRWSDAAAYVFGSGHGLKVLGVYAVAHTTEVVELESTGDRADLLLVDPAVSEESLSVPDDDAVAIGNRLALPDVTRSRQRSGGRGEGVESERLAASMAAQETQRLAFDEAFLGAIAGSERDGLPAPALTKMFRHNEESIT